MKKFSILALLLISFMVLSQGDPYQTMLKGLYSHTVPLITREEMKTLISDRNEVQIFDTRSEDEFEISHVPGAYFIDYDSFNDSLLHKFNKKLPVIVYCSVGYRSEKIGEKFIKNGFKEVYNLYGGVFDWVNHGFTIVDKEGKPTENIHPYSPEWGIWLKKGNKVYE